MALTVMDAVDNLSNMAEIDLAQLEKGVDEESTFHRWLDPKRARQNEETIKETFQVINRYMKNLYEKDRGQLKDPETRRGIQAIMLLAGEAAQKVDTCTGLFKGVHASQGITELPEYQDLQQFYLTKMVKKLQQEVPSKESWQAEWKNAGSALDLERQGLKDLERVRRDREYELFYIRKEDGTSFFNRNLLRHIKLVGEFDETLGHSMGEDPFLQARSIQDKDIQFGAKEILRLAAPYIEEFYREGLHFKEMDFVASMNKALMALMLAANPRNLLENTGAKSCLSYYSDFHAYLRQALSSAEYHKHLSHPPDKEERFFHNLLNLSHVLCSFFFMRPSLREKAIGFIHRLIEKGQKEEGALVLSSEPIWHHFLDRDEQMRLFLKRYPNGPLLKTLDVFREGDEKLGFDPLSQGNLPLQLFVLFDGKVHVTCLHLPCPTKQEFINEVEVVEEFLGFLRSLSSALIGHKKHLFINLQDRTSWEEHGRSLALERLQKEPQFSQNLVVITLAKNTDFYLQRENYRDIHEAKDFIKKFQEELASAEACGFYFPSSVKTKKMENFIEDVMQVIHQQFFAGKTVFTRQNRLDFIEIFYHFYVLKLIEQLAPDSLSFTCKDAIDVGAAAGAGFYAFLRMMKQADSWKKEEKDFLLWMLYAPALFIRERLIDDQRFRRFVSAMSIIQAELDSNRKEILQAFSALYEPSFLAKIDVIS